MAKTLNQEETQRVNNVYNEREQALAENNQLYGDLMNQAGDLKNQQNAYLAEQQKTQDTILDKQLAYQSGLINQQKEEASQNKRVEENKAYNAYLKYTNPFGKQSERMTSLGLGESGVSETSKLGAFTTYQNRLANANASYQKAVTQYDNAMNEAVLNNDVQKAQNALNMLKLQLENNQDYFSNISSLSQAKLKNQQSVRSEYNDLYNTVYNQIFNEQRQAEDIRQYNEQMAFNREKQAEAVRQYNEDLALQKAKLAEDQRQFNEQLALSKKKVASSGSSSKSGNTKTASLETNSSESKGETVKSTTSIGSPSYMSSTSAFNWYKDNIQTKKSWDSNDLMNKLESAQKSGKITMNDAQHILSTYGIHTAVTDSQGNVTYY